MTSKLSLLLVVAFCYTILVQSFSTWKSNVLQRSLQHQSFSTTSSRSALMMGGGRSLEEKKRTKRQLFQDVKKALNEAAKLPGFFESGDGTPELELYLKSNGDGTQIGDCPFAQFIQLILLTKGIRYSLKPTLSTKKPDWLVEKHNGALPTLKHKDFTISDSIAIAEYLEKTFPANSLSRKGVYTYQEVLEKISTFFPALASYIKNQDPSRDPEFQAKFEEQLDLLDDLLSSTPGLYLGGTEKTLADLYLAPQLFHAVVALDHFKEFEFYRAGVEPTRPALEAYVQRVLSWPEFNNKKAYYNVDQVVYGWKTARGEK